MSTAEQIPENALAENLLDHEYDGIREYDNPTPGWWHLIFLSSILFAALYISFWHFSPVAWTVEDAWNDRQVADYKRIFGSYGNLKPDQDTILSLISNNQLMAVAKSVFGANCVACHAKDGGGINGVNLTDDAYKNVKVPTDLFKTITQGALNGAMPAWGQRLSENERVILASFVASLRGTKPANPKPPEGEVIPPWPAPPAPSTSKPAPAATAVTTSK